MRYASAAAFRTSLEQRLATQARQTGLQLVRLRRLVVFDRLLVRLDLVAPGCWLVKGGVALDLRMGHHARTTQDIDVMRDDQPETITRDLQAVQLLDVNDFFTFSIQRVGDVNALIDGSAARFRVQATLAGRPFETVILDIGLRDPVLGEPDVLPGTDLLAFAEIERLNLATIPVPHHLAEKLHAYSRVYPGDRSSSRVKDLVDIVLIATHMTISAQGLIRALNVTFDTRGTHPLPDAVPAPPPAWRVPYQRLTGEVGLDGDLAAAHQVAAQFFDPILRRVVPPDALWSAERQAWG